MSSICLETKCFTRMEKCKCIAFHLVSSSNRSYFELFFHSFVKMWINAQEKCETVMMMIMMMLLLMVQLGRVEFVCIRDSDKPTTTRSSHHNLCVVIFSAAHSSFSLRKSLWDFVILNRRMLLLFSSYHRHSQRNRSTLSNFFSLSLWYTVHISIFTVIIIATHNCRCFSAGCCCCCCWFNASFCR